LKEASSFFTKSQSSPITSLLSSGLGGINVDCQSPWAPQNYPYGPTWACWLGV